MELVKALGRAGQSAEGLAVIEETIARSEESEERWRLPDLLRIRGELLLLECKANAAIAEENFQRALDLARRQRALAWELRAATSLAQLQRERSCAREAHDLLSSIYGRFAEGFETADLRRAKRLMDELAGDLAKG